MQNTSLHLHILYLLGKIHCKSYVQSIKGLKRRGGVGGHSGCLTIFQLYRGDQFYLVEENGENH